MNLIDALLGEHAALKTVFAHIEKFQSGWGVGQLQETAALLEDLLSAHGVLEDELLFDLLPADKEAMNRVLEAMRGEHHKLRGLISELLAAEDERHAHNLLSQLLDLAREHFAVEERVLFHLASEAMGSERLQNAGREWARRRQLHLPA